ITAERAVRDTTIQNITFDCDQPANDHVATALFPNGSNFTIRNCKFLNVDSVINANNQPHGLMMENCTAPLEAGMRGYFVWLEGTDACMLGNSAANSVFQHVIRGAGYTRALIADNHLTN